jgi:hypothetical protein
MEITVQELQKRGFVRRNSLIQGLVKTAYQKGVIILYLMDDGYWYLQTIYDYPSFYAESPFVTFKQFNELLKSIKLK